MPTFIYSARDKSGKQITGEIIGESHSLVENEIVGNGLFPVSISHKTTTIAPDAINLFQRKLKPKELANITRQFEVMFSVGTRVDKALETLANQTQHKGLKEALTHIKREVAGGMRLSQAFSRYPKFFSPLYISMLEMGQTGGVLSQTLKEMAKILEKESKIKSKVKSATLYPKIVCGTLLVVGWAMLAFVFPPFKAFYSGHNTELPMPTQVVMGLSAACTTYWYMPLTLGIGAYVGYKYFAKSTLGHELLSILAYKVPVFGKLNLLVANSRFGHLISALYRAGLPLANTLSVVANTMTNAAFAKEIRLLKEDLEQGLPLSQSMKKTKHFAPMVKETCAIGEQTGKLDLVLDATADFYDEEIDDILDNLSTLIEPIMLFCLFFLVGGLALAVYMPIWNMSKAVL